MATTCFFCENLLSDYTEGILPAARHEEIKKHLDQCPSCKRIHGNLLKTLDILHGFKGSPIAKDTVVRITEAALGHRAKFHKQSVSRIAVMVCAPLLFFVAVSIAFPTAFPWLSRLRQAEDDSQFVRYFPLLQGAPEILDEQASWLYVKDPLMGSLWEEGGMSPDEFEKTFQKKGVKGSEP